MAKRLEIGTPHYTGVRSFWTGITVGLVFILMLAGLLIFMESQFISSTPIRAVVNVIEEEEDGVCSPRIRNASDIEYHSGHRYYSLLKDIDPPVPTFRNTHTVLCDEDARAQAGFSYCLRLQRGKTLHTALPLTVVTYFILAPVSPFAMLVYCTCYWSKSTGNYKRLEIFLWSCLGPY